MSEFSYPTDPAEMTAFILQRADPTGANRAAVEAAAAELETAQRNLADARQRLAAHESTAPDADPEFWGLRRRALADAIPAYEQITNGRAAWAKQTQQGYLYEVNRVAVEIDASLHQMSKHAWGAMYAEVRRLEAEIVTLKRGETDEIRAVGRSRTAYAVALKNIGLV